MVHFFCEAPSVFAADVHRALPAPFPHGTPHGGPRPSSAQSPRLAGRITLRGYQIPSRDGTTLRVNRDASTHNTDIVWPHVSRSRPTDRLVSSVRSSLGICNLAHTRPHIKRTSMRTPLRLASPFSPVRPFRQSRATAGTSSHNVTTLLRALTDLVVHHCITTATSDSDSSPLLLSRGSLHIMC